MCTAICLRSGNGYFGRTLDLEYSYQEKVTVTPRNYPIRPRHLAPLFHHYAFIGMAIIADEEPLYYDGINEHGLAVAGLNFPGNAQYYPACEGHINVAHYELIPWVLASFKNVDELLNAAAKLNITEDVYNDLYPAATLHWIVSDSTKSVVIESTESGLHIYDNPWDVLTNNPPFPMMIDNLRKYNTLTNLPVNCGFTNLEPDSRGTGSQGLPGDLTSKSRFVRVAFHKHFSVAKNSESALVSQFYHILGSVNQVQGCVKVGNQYVKTQYTSCCNMQKCIYYYTTYENSQITGISLFDHNLDGKQTVIYPLIRTQQFNMLKPK